MKPGLDSYVLDCFWKLSDLNSARRIEGASKLASVCSAQNENVSYSIERLVGGLSSPRLASRLGYSVAIGALLENGTVSVQTLIGLLDQKLPLKGNENSKGNAIGQALAYSTVLASSMPKPLESTDLGNILKKLMQIREEYSHLEVLIDDAVISFSSNLDKSVFKNCVWQYFEGDCKAEPENMTLRGLWMLLVCDKHFPKIVKDCPLKKCSSFFAKELAPVHAKLLQGCAGFHTGLHPAVAYLVDCLLDEERVPAAVLADYWNKVVVEGLARYATEKVRHLAVRVSTRAVSNKHISDDQLLAIISQPFLDTIYKCVTNKSAAKAMHKAWRAFLSILRDKIEGGEISGRVVTGLLCSMNLVSLSFDRCTTVPLGDVLVAHLPVDGIQEYLNNRLEIVCETNSTRDKQDWLGALKQVQKLTFRLRDKPKLVLKIMNKLTTILNEGMEEVPEAEEESKKKIAKERADAVRANILSILDWLLTVIHRKGHRTQVVITNQDLNIVYDWIKKNVSKIPEKSQRCIESVQPKLKQILKDDKLDGEKKALSILLVYDSAWLLLAKDDQERKKFGDALTELQEIYSRFDGTIKVQAGPPWLDVLLDLILSLMSNANRHVRHALPAVMHFLTPIIEFRNLEPILEALSIKEVDAMMEEENDTDTENGSESEHDDDKDLQVLQGEPNSASESSSSEADADSDEAEDVQDSADPEITESVKQALGDARAHTDADESDFSDDTMLRLDDMIARAFRLRLGKRGGKKSKQALLQQARDYRLKCLDLVQIVVESNPHPHVLINLIPPLLKIGNDALRIKDQELMYSRTKDVIHTIRNLKMDWAKLDKQILLQAYENLYDASEAMTNPIFQAISGDCAAFILSKEMTDKSFIDLFVKKLERFMIERTCHIPSAVFEMQIQRHPNILFPVLSKLGAFAFSNEQVRPIRKSEAVIWSRLLMRRDVTSEHKDEKQMKQFAAGLKKIITDLESGKMNETEIKPKFLAECVITLLHASHLGERDIFLDDELKEVVKKLGKKHDENTADCVKAVAVVLHKMGRSLQSMCAHILNESDGKRTRKRKRNKRKSQENGKKKQKVEQGGASSDSE